MHFKKLFQAIFVALMLVAISACTHTGKKNSDSSNVAYEDAAATGLGEGSNYGDGENSRGLLAKRTYYFDYDKSEVHESDKPAIYANADYLIANPSAKIILEGHTDPRGSREYNVGLGERRANSVAEMMKSKGVAPHQIRVVSYGAEQRALAGHTEQDYQMDRRAVIGRMQG